jgi:hypothetical protein
MVLWLHYHDLINQELAATCLRNSIPYVGICHSSDAAKLLTSFLQRRAFQELTKDGSPRFRADVSDAVRQLDSNPGEVDAKFKTADDAPKPKTASGQKRALMRTKRSIDANIKASVKKSRKMTSTPLEDPTTESDADEDMSGQPLEM